MHALAGFKHGLSAISIFAEDRAVCGQHGFTDNRFFDCTLALDLLLPRLLEIFGGASEIREALAERAAQLRQLARAEDDERDDQNQEQLARPQALKDK